LLGKGVEKKRPLLHLAVYPSFAHVLNVSVILVPVKKAMIDTKELEKTRRKTVIKDVIHWK